MGTVSQDSIMEYQKACLGQTEMGSEDPRRMWVLSKPPCMEERDQVEASVPCYGQRVYACLSNAPPNSNIPIGYQYPKRTP